MRVGLKQLYTLYMGLILRKGKNTVTTYYDIPGYDKLRSSVLVQPTKPWSRGPWPPPKPVTNFYRL